MEQIVIHTDGSCLKNPGGPGGWAAVITRNGSLVAKLSGHIPESTNNQSELTAAIEGLKAAGLIFPPNSSFTVVTDSQYVKNGITEWIAKWKRNGWRSSDKKPVKNQDLWMQLDAQSANLRANWSWVRGHTGHPMNEMCDELAGKAARLAGQGIDMLYQRVPDQALLHLREE